MIYLKIKGSEKDILDRVIRTNERNNTKLHSKWERGRLRLGENNENVGVERKSLIVVSSMML